MEVQHIEARQGLDLTWSAREVSVASIIAKNLALLVATEAILLLLFHILPVVFFSAPLIISQFCAGFFYAFKITSEIIKNTPVKPNVLETKKQETLLQRENPQTKEYFSRLSL